ncbi:MAG: ATP-binding protein [Thermodesulfobacteriota bacterium]
MVDIRHSQESVHDLAVSVARTTVSEEMLFRKFFCETAIYRKVTKDFTPAPALGRRNDRDIISADGAIYTMISPLRLLDSVHQAASGGMHIRTAIKTFQPLDTGEKPDGWEKAGLAALRAGKSEVSEVVEQQGELVLRFMAPARATPGCVARRPCVNLKEGDLLGGISVLVPMVLFNEKWAAHDRAAFATHGLLLLLGMTCLGWSFVLLRRRDAALHKSQLEMRKAKNELEKTFDAIGDIITIQNHDMRITRINRAGCAAFGASERDLVGKYCYEVFRGIMTPCPECPEAHAFAEKKIYAARIEHKNLRKTFVVSAAPIVGDNGEMEGIVHCAKDITGILTLEGQLRQAQKMESLGTLAGGIAHDFNNILTAIMGFTELAKAKLPPESPVAKDLAEVLKGCQRAMELIRQILTFSRQREQEYLPLKVQSIAKEVLKLLRSGIPANIEMRQRINDSCGCVIADPSQIHQVVMNLCTNAYHAMRNKGGILEVSLEPIELTDMDVRNKIALAPGHYLRLTVSDTGTGIEPVALERIFEPYFTTKGKGEGTGLGLSVVHGIVEGIGGTITVYSEAGRGTTFHIYLPVVEADPVMNTEAGSSVQIPSGNERILVVDDEESVVTVEKRILESLGYQVTSFTDCAGARDAFLAAPQRFDLLLTDMYMPGMTGKELVAVLRAIRPDLPVLMCTGFSKEMDKEKARELGIGRLMMKPMAFIDLARAVREVLDKKDEIIVPFGEG